MSRLPCRILVAAADAETAERLRDRVVDALKDGVVVPAPPRAVMAEAGEQEPDLLLLDLAALPGSVVDVLAELRGRLAEMPLLGLGSRTPVSDGRAGTAPTVAGSEPEQVDAGPAVPAGAGAFGIGREMGTLSGVGGSGVVPVTERIFGTSPLRQAAPVVFDELVVRYAELLDRALLVGSSKDYNLLVGDLNDIADRAGAYGAGPRDIVDLHKVAIGSRLEGTPGAKQKAYVEEGRLLLIQLMGYLVSHYRSLSWGRRSVPEARGKTAVPGGSGPSATRETRR